MKKYLTYLYISLLPFAFWACNNDEEIDTAHSIFEEETSEEEMNELDKWLLENYVYPYNIQFKYRLDDNETDVEHDLVPADYNKSFDLARIVKYVWMEAYDEVWGIETTRTYVPKTIQLVGNVAYTASGMILGQAEQGMKVMLFNVNNLDMTLEPDALAAYLNEYYFKTMHHEFCHILNQNKAYDTAFDLISEGDYQGAAWSSFWDEDALPLGFISAYAMDRGGEDFAEMMSIYVTNTPEAWEARLQMAGSARSIIEEKLKIVDNYMRDSWGVELDELRDVVLRRQGEIDLLFN